MPSVALPRLHRLPCVLAVACLGSFLATGTSPAGASALDAADSPDTAQAEEIVLPTNRCGDYFLVQFAFKGDEEKILRFLYDTGAGNSVVDPDAVERVSGQSVAVGRWVRFGELNAGPATVNKMRARVQELDHLIHALGYPMDGILGFPTFEDMLTTFDYADGELRLVKGRLGKPDDVEIFALSRRERRRPWLPVEIAGEPRTILLDSGSSSSLSLRAWDDAAWDFPPTVAKASVHIDRYTIYRAGRLADDIRLGSTTIPQPIVSLTEKTEILGTQILRYFDVTFDQKSRRVRLRRTGDGPITIAPVRSTGAFFRAHADNYEIIKVLPTSPAAEADLRVGDRVTAFNGRPVTERECGVPYSDSANDATLTLTVTRAGGAPEHVTVPLVELVP